METGISPEGHQHGEVIVQPQPKQNIARDMTIGDVVRQYPEVIETLLSFGVHCVGCQASYWETLEDGFRGHGMSEEDIDQAVAALNAVIAETGSKPLTLTDKAAQKIVDFRKQQNKDESYALRIGVKKGGCAGNSYTMDFDNALSEADEVLEEKGIKIVIAKEAFPSLQGVKIDYVESMMGSGFHISNPNAKASCGCGKSFK